MDRILGILVAGCLFIMIPICGVTRSWGWPWHQATTAAALLLPVVAYASARLWFRRPSSSQDTH